MNPTHSEAIFGHKPERRAKLFEALNRRKMWKRKKNPIKMATMTILEIIMKCYWQKHSQHGTYTTSNVTDEMEKKKNKEETTENGKMKTQNTKCSFIITTI